MSTACEKGGKVQWFFCDAFLNPTSYKNFASRLENCAVHLCLPLCWTFCPSALADVQICVSMQVLVRRWCNKKKESFIHCKRRRLFINTAASTFYTSADSELSKSNVLCLLLLQLSYTVYTVYKCIRFNCNPWIQLDLLQFLEWKKRIKVLANRKPLKWKCISLLEIRFI